MPGPGGIPTTYSTEFSSSGGSGAHDNPPSASKPYEVHCWLLERLSEGDRINRSDPAYERASKLVADVMGDQPTGAGYPNPTMQDSRRVVLNQIRKTINVHASMLTDVKPVWEYRTENPAFKAHAARYNKMLLVWWLRTFADLELAQGVRYAATIGASDIVFQFDKTLNGGDMRMQARDWRDTIPIRPGRTGIQDWEGVILCEAYSAAKIRAVFPGSREIIEDAGTGQGVGVFTQYRRMTSPEKQVTTLSGLGEKDPARYTAQRSQPLCVVYRAWFNDRSINTSDSPVLMGPPGANWSYLVPVGSRLYPRGRHVCFTAKGLLYDQPHADFHGRWPVARLSLQPWPWLMVGLPLAYDLRQLAGMLNITVNDILQVFSQWVHRGSVWGKNAPKSLVDRFNPTVPNWKVQQNQLVGTGFEMADGPNLPPWTLQFLGMLFQKWDELSGVANLQQLLTLRQSPGADTLEKYMQAMTPEIRMEAREVERFMREIADLYLYDAAQYYSKERRIAILGESGLTLEDVDYDPGTMIPSMMPGQVGYSPDLDSRRPRDARAKAYLSQFGFYATPNSILGMHAQERKMMMLQLSRQGYVDYWTLLETMEVPNVGEPPLMNLPVSDDFTPEQIAQFPPGPDGKPQVPTTLRRPETITERLQAMQQLGLGQVVSAAGRKASGQEPPHMQAKADGSSTVAES